MTLFNIDALFQKEFRLKTFTSSDNWNNYTALMGPVKSYNLIIGKALSGKSTIGSIITKYVSGSKAISVKEIEQMIRKSKGTEEEPYEGDI